MQTKLKTNSEKVQVVIFDFDGTLADTFDLAVNKIKKLSDRFKQDLSKKEIEDYIKKRPLKEIIKEFKINKLELFFLLWEVKREFREIISHAKPYEEVNFLLNELKKENFQLGILSSNSIANIQIFLKKYNLEGYFDFIKTKSSLFSKDKAILKIIKEKKLNKKNIIYVGDEVRDYEACKNINLKCILVSYGFNSLNLLKSSNPEYIVASPLKIVKVLSEINS